MREREGVGVSVLRQGGLKCVYTHSVVFFHSYGKTSLYLSIQRGLVLEDEVHLYKT